MLAETTGATETNAAVAVVNDQERTLRDIDERLAQLKREIPRLARERDEAQKISGRWHELEAARKAASAREAKATTTLSLTAYDEAQHHRVRKEHERLLAIEEEATALREATADTPYRRTQLDEQAGRLAELRQQLADVERELKELKFDNVRLAALAEAAKETEDARDEAQETLTTAKLEAQSRSQEVQTLREGLDEAKKSQEIITSKTHDVRQHEVAAGLLSKYRDQQARRAWPRLEQVASGLLNAATDGRYADVRLSDDYRIIVVDRGEEHELARFSGGEQDLANLCLRLAIADWVSKERNVDLGFVILDEVFGSQDEERRQRLLSELRGLSSRFRQTLLITHLPELAELCDSQLEVAIAEPGRSTAAIV